ncbi:MAG: adenosine kinase [Thermodesulfobacteriota bacterium]|nr:adenosine kinase [Thermodesulfobacteriota bacterium]
MFNGKKKITGVGSALVDMLIREEDTYVKALGAEKGGMTLVENDFIEKALEQTPHSPEVVSGGSACNTIVGVGRLGGDAHFVGVLGKDGFGDIFTSDLEKNCVYPMLAVSQTPTGKVLSVITPDAQRTMFTHLGASTELDPAGITEETFQDTAIAVVEGYLLFNPELMKATVNAAQKAGARVSLDLASFDVVENCKSLLEEIAHTHVDILIANEDEARAFTGHSDEDKALAALSEYAEIAVLKVGKRGSYIAHAGKNITIAPQMVDNAVDTTGAGDLWAAGFLFGLVNGYPLEKCGELASACGAEVVQVIGAKIPEEGWERIRKLL